MLPKQSDENHCFYIGFQSVNSWLHVCTVQCHVSGICHDDGMTWRMVRHGYLPGCPQDHQHQVDVVTLQCRLFEFPDFMSYQMQAPVIWRFCRWEIDTNVTWQVRVTRTSTSNSFVDKKKQWKVFKTHSLEFERQTTEFWAITLAINWCARFSSDDTGVILRSKYSVFIH